MFLDTSFNTIQTVLYNIYTAFVETAEKTWTYARCLPVGKQPGTDLMISEFTSSYHNSTCSLQSYIFDLTNILRCLNFDGKTNR